MRVQSSFAFLLLPLAGALSLTGCPGPDDHPPWASDSCYCDDTGYCADYSGNVCTVGASSGSSGTSGASGGASSSGFGGSSGTSSGASGTTSSGGSSGTTSSGGSSGTSSGGSSGASSGQSSSGDIDGGTSSGGGSGGIDAGPAPNCASDAECGSNQTCSGGFCRFECTTSAECKLYDSRLDVCDQGVCKSE